MFRTPVFLFFLLISAALFPSPQLYAQDQQENTKISQFETDKSKKKKVDLILRFGQGGFRDSRSPTGQLALDIKSHAQPVAISISSEYYTNSSNPAHSYEISRMLSLNMLYMTQLSNFERAKVFFGGGIGQLEVPRDGDSSDRMEKGNLFNLEAGINVRAFWKIRLIVL